MGMLLFFFFSLFLLVTVFSGFLGAGKTTIILNLISQLKAERGESYTVCLLKNEYGDVAVDSRMAAEKNIQVKEMLQGWGQHTVRGREAEGVSR